MSINTISVDLFHYFSILCAEYLDHALLTHFVLNIPRSPNHTVYIVKKNTSKQISSLFFLNRITRYLFLIKLIHVFSRYKKQLKLSYKYCHKCAWHHKTKIMHVYPYSIYNDTQYTAFPAGNLSEHSHNSSIYSLKWADKSFGH